MAKDIVEQAKHRLHAVDRRATEFFAAYGQRFLRYSIGVIFIWFGALKPVGASPAAELVANTVFWFPPELFIPLLGIWEVIIGICFLYKPLLRLGILLLAPQMAGTFLPLLLLPDVVFQQFPFVLTLEGQYIIKNLVIIGGAMVLGGQLYEADKKKL